MVIGIPKERKAGETRVALTPEVIKGLIAGGFTVVVEPEAGIASFFSDEAYQKAGAEISSDVYQKADILLKVNAPEASEANMIKHGSAVISFLYAFSNKNLIEILNERKITAFAMDAVPRISRAQKMDALSSQANLAGYKAVLLGANALGKIFPLMMTAAGTITPAKILIFGAGVAGLQAIATAKRLGAVVECTDVRPETKEQVESLGGRFLEVKGVEGVVTEGGYTKEVSTEYLAKQKELVQERIKEMDLVITTALVMGKKAPLLVNEEMLKSMKPGSVLVDMAVESGGNCAGSEAGKTVQKFGVTIIGETNLPGLLPMNASQLYAVNVSTLLLHLATPKGLNLDVEEEITKGCMITHNGETVHAFTKNILENSLK